jgi:peptidoglycan/LPS O-acetylase OafA/YrhL
MNRNRNLDALRGIAILLVIGRHTYYSSLWHNIGWAGVDLFFVLSGFLVGGLLFAEFSRAGRIDIRRFYLRRGLKIWPAFYVLLGVSLVAGSHPSWPEALFFQNYLIPVPERVHTWSLAVEEHFYLLLPILLLAIRGNERKPFAAMPFVFAATTVIALGWRIATGWSVPAHTPGYIYLPRVIFQTQARIDALTCGALLAYLLAYRPAVFNRVAGFRFTWLAALAGIALIVRYDQDSRLMRTCGLTVIYLINALIVAKAFAFEGPVAVRLPAGALARIGIYSYSIYLWHVLFLMRLKPHIHAPAYLDFAVGTVGPIIFGIAAAKLIEMPALRLRDRILPRRAAATSVAAIGGLP